MAKYTTQIITAEFLDQNETAWFVFGDNSVRHGYGGAAALRDHPRAYGFITKKFPDNRDSSFYDVFEYREVFEKELTELKTFIDQHPENTFYISMLGAKRANRYHIWELVIKPNLEKTFENNDNVIFLWIK